jgi:hypothetical protein
VAKEAKSIEELAEAVANLKSFFVRRDEKQKALK